MVLVEILTKLMDKVDESQRTSLGHILFRRCEEELRTESEVINSEIYRSNNHKTISIINVICFYKNGTIEEKLPLMFGICDDSCITLTSVLFTVMTSKTYEQYLNWIIHFAILAIMRRQKETLTLVMNKCPLWIGDFDANELIYAVVHIDDSWGIDIFHPYIERIHFRPQSHEFIPIIKSLYIFKWLLKNKYIQIDRFSTLSDVIRYCPFSVLRYIYNETSVPLFEQEVSVIKSNCPEKVKFFIDNGLMLINERILKECFKCSNTRIREMIISRRESKFYMKSVIPELIQEGNLKVLYHLSQHNIQFKDYQVEMKTLNSNLKMFMEAQDIIKHNKDKK